MTSQKKLNEYIGRKIMVPALDYGGTKMGIEFGATSLDARSTYGRVQLFIQPLNGTGTAWVNMTRVRFEAAQKGGE